MQELFSLGELYVSDFLKEGESPRYKKEELSLVMEEDGNVHLGKTVPLDTMFGRYFYRSGINSTMRNELKDIVESILKVKKLKENDIWLDIACNDATLLSNVPKELIRIGIDPADDTYKIESEKHANVIVQDYFSAEAYKSTQYGHLKVKVITAIAMFYDVIERDKFLLDVQEIMDPDGLFVLQLSYSPLMISQLAFDNILFEHYYYYSLFNLKELLDRNGFKIVDVSLNNINAGSFRVYVMKHTGNIKTFATQTHRDVCEVRINSLLEYEKTLKLTEVETWTNFHKKVDELKYKLVSFIKKEKAKGKTIWGYGASTKSATTLQYMGIDNTLIDKIADRSPYKWGLFTSGTNIQIVSEDEMRKAQPDYVLILIFHFLEEIMVRESEYLSRGGKFIIPMPKFEIIDQQCL